MSNNSEEQVFGLKGWMGACILVAAGLLLLGIDPLDGVISDESQRLIILGLSLVVIASLLWSRKKNP
tara:strand:+ start:367 stop:567 length:201 start_codon:yes stop_codon:yes gene_type:complete